MKVVVKRVGEKPEVREIENDLDVFQKIVGGLIECVRVVSNIVLICNEEGKLRGLPVNFSFYGDLIAGDVFFCTMGEDDFEGLSDEDIEFVKLALN